MIESGIAPGELVVVDGTDRLREGAKVELITRDAPAGRGLRRSAPRRRARATGLPGSGPPGDGQRRMKSGGLSRAMNPSRLFILRPVATSLLMVAILLSGIVAYRLLPLSALPQVDYPTIQVRDALSRARAPT